MTRFEPTQPLKTYATLRITGDRLIPGEIAPLLRRAPTLAYAKGEHYCAGPRSPDLIGRTGVWYFCTDENLQSTLLADHLRFLLDQVVPREQPHVRWFRQFLKDKSLNVVVTCFWRGPHEAKPAMIPAGLDIRLKQIPASIETDFDLDAPDTRSVA